MPLSVRVLSSESWVPAVTSAWLESLARQPDLRMCLPTGATPRPLYRQVARDGDFSRSTVFLLDEFGLPHGDPGRCDSMLARDLIELLDAPPARMERLNPDAEDLDQECRRFAIEVASDGLDLTLLGLGANGHLGLNEPGSDPRAPTRVVELAAETRKSLAGYGARADTTWGMTLGMSELLASREIWLLVRGERKAPMLHRTVTGPVTPEVPATFLREAEGHVVIWADEDAASLL